MLGSGFRSVLRGGVGHWFWKVALRSGLRRGWKSGFEKGCWEADSEGVCEVVLKSGFGEAN